MAEVLDVMNLEGAELDAAVAKTLGLDCWLHDGHWVFESAPQAISAIPRYSVDWEAGGPLLEPVDGAVDRLAKGVWCAQAGYGLHRYQAQGETPLVALMRAFVGSHRVKAKHG
jgi:hypothetical protein